MSVVLNTVKAKAYPLLTMCGLDHVKAVSQGYTNGWHMLLDRHDDNGAAMFYMMVADHLSSKQAKVLFDGIVEEFTDYPDHPTYTDAVCEMDGNGIPPFIMSSVMC
jgi:hypothetical protein